MKKELGIQLYTVKDYLNSQSEIESTFSKLSSYGYTQIQTCYNFPFGAKEFADAAKKNNLEIIGTHLDIDFIEKIDECVKLHKILGTTNVGVGGISVEPDKLTEYIERVNRIAENLSKYGMKFTYHNHAIEFMKIGNETIMEILERGFDKKNISFVLDTYWVQHGGASIIEWIERLAGRIDILHLKDKAVRSWEDIGITELGSGNINFRDILKIAEATGVKYYCYEQDSDFSVNSLDSAKRSAEYFFSIL